MRQEQIRKASRPRPRPIELAPLALAPGAPDFSDADDIIERIDAALAPAA